MWQNKTRQDRILRPILQSSAADFSSLRSPCLESRSPDSISQVSPWQTHRERAALSLKPVTVRRCWGKRASEQIKAMWPLEKGEGKTSTARVSHRVGASAFTINLTAHLARTQFWPVVVKIVQRVAQSNCKLTQRKKDDIEGPADDWRLTTTFRLTTTITALGEEKGEYCTTTKLWSWRFKGRFRDLAKCQGTGCTVPRALSVTLSFPKTRKVRKENEKERERERQKGRRESVLSC